MKRFKIYLLIILPIALMSSNCKKNKKDDPDNYQILKGRIMEDCSTPYASKKILLSGDNAFSDKFCVDVNGNSEFYTDANGYFEINFKRNGNWGTLYAPYKVMSFIPIGTNDCLDVGEVNLNGTINFIIKLEANNAYTSNDTLIFGDWNNIGPNSEEIRLAGPFSNQILDTALNVLYNEYPLIYGETPKMSIIYYLKSWPDIKRANVSQKFCSGANDFANATFVLD